MTDSATAAQTGEARTGKGKTQEAGTEPGERAAPAISQAEQEALADPSGLLQVVTGPAANPLAGPAGPADPPGRGPVRPGHLRRHRGPGP